MEEIKQKAKDFIDEFHRTSFQKKDVIELLVCFANQETERLNKNYEERGNYILSLDKQLRSYVDKEVKLNRKINEAKDIIKELIYADGRFADKYPKLINKAEDFIKEK